MSIHSFTTVDFHTIEQPNHTAPCGKRTIFARLRQTLANLPRALLGILPATHTQDPAHLSGQQPTVEPDDIDWPPFYQYCDCSLYWVY